jgi:hypothetical protein
MDAPRYFVAIFGDPQPPHKDVVESGVYHPQAKYAPFPSAPGDVMLLYCTGTYAQHDMHAPGIGIVLDRDNQCVKYRYLQLSEPISKETIERYFEPTDATKFKNRRFDQFWLFQISPRSFAQTVGARNIVWQ